jgi:hypothetical protein
MFHQGVSVTSPRSKSADENGVGRDVATTSGDLFLLKWVVAELQQDLDCRLEVFAASLSLKGVDANHKTMRDRRCALLQNSQLWRTFSVSHCTLPRLPTDPPPSPPKS